MRLEAAFTQAGKQIGLNERDQSAAIQDYLSTGGVNLDPTTTAWCAAFVNATLAQNGMEGTGSNLARSFMQWGQETSEPKTGDLAVFSRGDPSGPYGHVGFFNGYDENGDILVLGGNQGDSVKVSPYSKNRLLGFRTAGNGMGQPAPPQGAGMGVSPSAQGPMGIPSQQQAQQDRNALLLQVAQQFAPKTNRLDPEAFMNRTRF